MTEMTQREIIRFLMKGTFTGKLATVKNDGSSHVVPVWFVLDDKNRKNNNIGSVCFTIGQESVKAQNIQRDSRVCFCVDDQAPPFTFVMLEGNAEITPYKQKEVLKWATKIAERYMGKKVAKAYGERNSGRGEVLVRIRPNEIIGEKNIAS
jgi:PPOX class probable F420-dependent enzyme